MREKTIKQEGLKRLSQQFGCFLRNNLNGAFRKLHSDEVVKSGVKGYPDTTGYIPVIVSPNMVGKTIAVFVGVEWKQPGERPTPQQRKCLERMKRDGARAGVASSVEEAVGIIQGR